MNINANKIVNFLRLHQHTQASTEKGNLGTKTIQRSDNIFFPKLFNLFKTDENKSFTERTIDAREIKLSSKRINSNLLKNMKMSTETPMRKGAEVSSGLPGQDKLSDSVCKPDDVVGRESFFRNDSVQLDSVQRKRNAAEEIIKNGTLLLGENHQQSDSRVMLLDLIAGGKVNKLFLEIPDYNLRDRFMKMKGKSLENSAEWANTKNLIDELVGSSETENRVKMSDLIHSALAKGIDVYPMDKTCGVGAHPKAMRLRNIHMGDIYKTAATVNEPGVAILVGDDHLKTFPAQAASGFMRGRQEVPSLTDCCSLSPGQVLRYGGET